VAKKQRGCIKIEVGEDAWRCPELALIVLLEREIGRKRHDERIPGGGVRILDDRPIEDIRSEAQKERSGCAAADRHQIGTLVSRQCRREALGADVPDHARVLVLRDNRSSC
jgi:hypothetical protein